MAKLTKADLADIQANIARTGIRLHIIAARSGLSTKARLWHPDGIVLATANGGGYDKAGTVLGDAITTLIPQEALKAMPREYVRPSDGYTQRIHGIVDLSDGRRMLDGGCGFDSMITTLRALGFDVQEYQTGKLSRMVVASKAGGQ